MAKISVKLNGVGAIDNAAIFFDDPQERLPYYLQPQSNTVWTANNISIPMQEGDDLSYVLYVVAFTGTEFECVVTDQDTQKTIVFSDKTGRIIKNRAITKGTEKFK